MACCRCGRDVNIEKHHIKHRIDGGNDSKDNLEDRCRDCHKYQHAKERLLDNIIAYADQLRRYNPESKYYNKTIENIQLQLKRLEVLETENTVQLIVCRGYYPYWNNPESHGGNNGFKFK